MTRVLLKSGKFASLLALGAIMVATSATAATPHKNCPGTDHYDPNVQQGSQCYSRIALYAGAHSTKTSTTCTTWTPNAKGIACPDLPSWNVNWPTGSSNDTYLVVAMAPNVQKGIAGMSCGVQYNNGQANTRYCGSPQVAPASDAVGVDVFGWTLCTTGLEFTNGCDLNNSATEWPESGGGNRITWNATPTDCGYSLEPGSTTELQVTAGSFYLYAYSQDLFELTANDNLLSGPGEFQVADCDAAVSDLIFPQMAGKVGFGASFSGYNPCSAVATKETTWGKIKTQY